MIKQETLRYSVTQKQSIYPSKLVLYNDVIKWDVVRNMEVKGATNAVGRSIEKKFHNFELSSISRSKIIKKINWLFHCAKSRRVVTYSGKEIYNFKINFITLTLPSKQVHPTSEITDKCFERLLNELRNRCKMVNYVWRIEFQGNGNVHYHIVTDSYIDYFFVLKIWNRIINYLGYVDRYADKMNSTSLAVYCENSKEQNFEINKKRYLKGRAEKWQNPNSVDVKSANSQANIASYISKYFSKKNEKKTMCNALDNEDNSFGLRLWFCSRSLSKLDVINEFVENAEIPFERLLCEVNQVKTIVYDYCTVIYFDFFKLKNWCKRELGQVFKDYSKRNGYVPCLV